MDHSDTPGATPGSPESDALVAWVIMQNGVEQDIIVEALESHSCRVCTPADMRAAVELVSQIPPSLVLLSTCQSDRAVQLTETLSTSLAREPCTFVMVTKDIEQIGSTAWSELGISEFLEVPATVSAAHNSVGPFCRIARLNRQLRDAEQRADAANRTKAEFLRNINHELRTPMTTIQGIAELLLDEGDIEQAPPHRVASLQELIDHAKEMSQRVDNILELSRLEDGAMEIRLRQVSPLDILNTIRKDFWHLATNKGLEFSVDLSGAVPQTVLTDADCLKQVLRHIVGNAVKFTSEGHVTVRSRTLLQLSRPLWKLEICDSGIGIPAKKMGILFRPFVQADMSPSRDHGGIGVGLSISNRLIQMLGGSVQVHSTEGEGTTVTVVVETGPLDDVEMQPEAEATAQLSRPPIPIITTPSRASKLHGRILLAEDAVANQRFLSAMLRRAGAEVAVVENGQLATDIALEAVSQGQPFDLILMDMQMPVLDGYHATSLLRSHGYQHPIVALTAHTFAGERESCLEVGCDEYLTKPVERESFIRFVSQYCRPNSRRLDMVPADVS